MKNLCILVVVLLAPFMAATAGLNCETVPFAGRVDTYADVRDEDSHRLPSDERAAWSIIKQPVGGYIGDVIVKDPMAEGSVARLTLRQVQQEDLFAPADKPVHKTWFSDMGLYNPRSPERDLLYEHTWKIDKVPFTIPVVLIGTGRSLVRCELKIVSRDGKELYACVPADVFQSRYSHYRRYHDSTAWVFTDDEEADRRLKHFAGISEADRYSVTPDDWADYASVSAIWIDETTELGPALMRRIMLSGCRIFGTREGLQPHLRRLGISETAILLGGIHALEKPDSLSDDVYVSSMTGASSLGFRDAERFRFSEGHYGNKGAAAVDDRKPLFDKIRVPYMVYTFTVAGLYAIGAVILLPVLFLRLKGVKRVGLWWKTPVAIATYTAVIAVVGWAAVHPKATISDATEYRLGYSDWPEVFCNVNVSSLKYGGADYGWAFPVGSIRTYIDHNAFSYLSVREEADSSGHTIMNGAVRGMRAANGFAYMKSMRQPFRATLLGTNVHEKVKIELSSTRPVENVFVRISDSKWVSLGDIKSDQATVLPESYVAHDIQLPYPVKHGMSNGRLDHLPLSDADVNAVSCENCGKVHSRHNRSLELRDGCLLVVGLDAEAPPAIRGLQKGQTHSERVVWICQVPLENFQNGGAN